MSIPAEQLQDKIREVLSRPDYREAAADPSDELAVLISRIIGWLLAPIRWLFALTEGLPDLMRWAIVGTLTLLLLALVVHMCWSLYRAVTGANVNRGRNRRRAAEELPQLQPAELERQAEAAAASGDLIQGIRLLFRACLLRLEQREKRPFRRGTTNRQHLSRYRGTRCFQPLEIFVRTIESKWYGDEVCGQDDYDDCTAAHRALLAALTGGGHADAS